MPVDRETATAQRLTEALGTGPFSLALRLAVQASGLSLDRVQCRLRERGQPVSKTALSNWQSGRTQPERPGSLRALTALEDVLGIPEGALRALLGPPRPRGRWLSRPPGELRPDQAWARPDGLARALGRMGASLDAVHQLAKVGLHVTISVSGQRRVDSIAHQLVVRAERDGVDRYVGATRSDRADPDPLRTISVQGCRLGRQREDDETGFLTFELLLDRLLRAGELAVLGYTVQSATGASDIYHAQRIGRSMRLYSVQVQFDQDALPVRTWRQYQPAVGEPVVETAELVLGAGRTAQFAVADPEPGIHRISWAWQ